LQDFNLATKNYTKNQQQLTAVEKERLRVERALETTQARIATANDKNTQSLTQQRGVLKTLNSEYAKLSQKHNEAARTVQDLIARGKLATQTQKQYNNELKVAQDRFNALNGRVIQADTAVKRFNRNVGNYPKAAAQNLRSLLGAFGLVSGIFLFAQAIRGAFTTVKDFDKANADLAATMGKTRKEITALTNDQKRLGATTKFTATEVAGLQKEFAKLGFSDSEILNATEATLALAAAVDTDLANAAMVAGATLRGFGLDASETGRVTDVMASSFTKSALDISNFAEAMKYVAPIAGQTGVSIEFATAMLGKLADAGVKGSQAGTSLRRILTEMAKTGLPAAQAFDKVAKSGISVTDAMDEVGRTAQTALLVLSKSKDGVNKLAKALDNAGGSAQKMADEQLNSLDGKLTLLASAWDGFILSLQEGDGFLTKSFIKSIDYLTKFLNLLKEANKGDKEFRQEAFSGSETNVVDFLKESVDDYIDILRKRGVKEEELNKERIAKTLEYAKKELAIKKLELYEAEKVTSAYEEVYKKRNSSLKNILTFGKSDDEAKKNLDNNILAIENYKGAIKGLESLISETLNPTIEEETKKIDNNTDATKNNAKAKQDVRFALVGSVEWFEKLKRALQEEQNQLSTNSEKWQEYQTKIDSVQKSIDAITKSVKEVEGLSIDINDDSYVTDADGDKLIEAGKEFRKMLQEFKQTFIDDFGEQSGFSLTLDLLAGGLDKFEGDAKSTALAVSEAFQQAFNTISQASEANFQREFERLEQQREVSLAFAGESATAKEEIDRQYEERRKAIQRRQAESEKRNAIFNIGINTAQAVVAALPNIPLSVAIGVIGAAQLALVASQSIPAFAEGGVHDGGLMLVNDAKGSNYREVIETPDGKLSSPTGRNVIMNAPKGTKIHTPEQWDAKLNSMLLDAGIQPIGNTPKIEIKNGITKDEMTQIMSKFANKDNYEFNIDENGIKKMITRNGQKVNILNSRLRIKGKDV
jgi:DNA repair exonuclease SbcCD ATPase subunit